MQGYVAMQTITAFNTAEHHIHLEFLIKDAKGTEHSVEGILDTGAPQTEFADQFLHYIGFVESKGDNIAIKSGLQTQKYGKVMIPSMTILGRQISNFEVCVSRFEASWGIDALIGLDFFRLFQVTIDFSKGIIIVQPFE